MSSGGRRSEWNPLKHLPSHHQKRRGIESHNTASIAVWPHLVLNKRQVAVVTNELLAEFFQHLFLGFRLHGIVFVDRTLVRALCNCPTFMTAATG